MLQEKTMIYKHPENKVGANTSLPTILWNLFSLLKPYLKPTELASDFINLTLFLYPASLPLPSQHSRLWADFADCHVLHHSFRDWQIDNHIFITCLYQSKYSQCRVVHTRDFLCKSWLYLQALYHVFFLFLIASISKDGRFGWCLQVSLSCVLGGNFKFNSLS